MNTQLVGLIIPDLMNDFYASVATIIQATLATEGYRLLLSVSGNDPKSEFDYLRAMRDERIEGLIWVPSGKHEQLVREYADDKVPIIEFARKTSKRLDGVVADDVGGSEAATKHLLDLGHKRIALIIGQTDLSTGRERLEGYNRALLAAGLRVDESLIKEGAFERSWGRQATEDLLDLAEPPAALFATSSEIVVGVLQALDRRQIGVPSQVSLIGYGDPDWFSVWRPPLTTVSFATEEMATIAVHSLLRKVRNISQEPRKPVLTRLTYHLTIRDSTGPVFKQEI
jgi:LacI family transcriptional regulator